MGTSDGVRLAVIFLLTVLLLFVERDSALKHGKKKHLKGDGEKIKGKVTSKANTGRLISELRSSKNRNATVHDYR